MAKSIKLKDNNYIDSTGIVHNKKLLSDLFNDTSNSGYQKLPSGLLIQWGNTQVTRNNSNEQAFTINYPKSFTTVFTVVACLNDAGYGYTHLNESVGIGGLTNNNFIATLKSNSGIAHNITVRYIAIGI